MAKMLAECLPFNGCAEGTKRTKRTKCAKCIKCTKCTKCVSGDVFVYASEYMKSCYNWGDRPQRAVQVGITGLSYLKYADATYQALNRIPKPIRPLMLNSKELQRTTASDPSLQP